MTIDDADASRDAFVYDRVTDTYTKLSRADQPFTRAVGRTSISDDGRFVTSGMVVFDRLTGAASHVDRAGIPVTVAAISGDGHFIALVTDGALGADDTNRIGDVYVRAVS